MEHQNTPQPANARACEVFSQGEWALYPLALAAEAIERGWKVRYLVLHEEQHAQRAALDALVRVVMRDLPTQQPLFWYRPRSDGCYEGPIHNSQIEQVRRDSGGWVPLAPVAMPATIPAPQLEAARADERQWSDDVPARIWRNK